MFTAVDRLFTTANFAFTLCNLEFAVEDLLGPSSGIVHPAGDGKVGFLHNLLDDGGCGGHLGDGSGNADGTRRRLDDAARSTNENFGFAASDLSLPLSNITLALSESLRPFWSDITPDALVNRWLRI